MSTHALLVSFLVVYSLANGSGADAFTLTNPSTSQRGETAKFRFRAKPSPKQGFDLEAIEAYESELEELEKKLQQQSRKDEEKSGKNKNLFDEVASEVGQTQIAGETRLVVPSELHNKRIDAAIAALIQPPLSRSVCGNLVADGHVKVISSSGVVDGEEEEDEVIDRKSFKVQKGMTLEISLPKDETPTEIIAQDLPLDILFEDEHMIVLNKAADMVVHPAAGNWDGTVVNALAYYLPRSDRGRGEFIDQDGKPIISSNTESQDDDNTIMMIEDHNNPASTTVDGQPIMDGESNTISFRPGIVHRLDKGTTGVLIVAKTSRALSALSSAFAARRVSKTYLAVTVGNPGRNVKIDKPIGRHPVHRQRMRVVPDPHQKNSKNRLVAPKVTNRTPSQAGRRALSYVDTLAFDGKLGLARVRIETGRTHQIRVHLQDRHTPIYGDDVYGLSDWNKRLLKVHQVARPLLHAYKLSLHHPITGEPMEFTAPLDSDMLRIANTIVPPGSEQELSTLLTWD